MEPQESGLAPASLRWGSAGIAVLAVAWRLATVSVGQLWRDWLLLTALLALVYVLPPRRRPAIALPAVMAFLLGIYVQGQWPHLIALFGGGP